MKPKKFLSVAFNPKSLILAAGLAASGAQGAELTPAFSHAVKRSDVVKTQPLPLLDIAVNGKPQILKPHNPDTPALNALKSEFGRTPLGRALLDFAEAENISIIFDAGIAASNNFAQYVPENSTITVRPDLSQEEQVLYLAHELRHSWQDKNLGYAALNARRLTPVQRFSLQRYVEADAHAFSAYFWADRIQRLGLDPRAVHAGFELSVAHKLKARMKDAGELAMNDYRDIALLPYFEQLGNYNDRHVAMAARASDALRAEIREAIASRAQPELRRLAQEISDAPGDAAFSSWLRRLGGLEIRETDKTALSAETDDALLKDFPLRGLTGNNNMPALGSASVAMPGPAVRLERLQLIDTKYRLMLLNPAPKPPAP